MANLYVRSTDGSDADNGSTWALAKATLAGAGAIDAVGDRIYVSQSHAESAAANANISVAGTVASPVVIQCANDGAEPPTTVATGGSVTTTGNTSIVFSGAIFVASYSVRGLTCSGGSGASGGGVEFNGGSSGMVEVLDCTLSVPTTQASARITFGTSTGGWSNHVVVKNTTVSFGTTGQGVRAGYGRVLWEGGGIAVGSSAITTFLNLSLDSRVLCCGLDLSNGASNMALVATTGEAGGRIIFRNCKLPASWSGTLWSSAPTSYLMRAEMWNCSATDTNYAMWVEDYSGSIKHETTILRTGGASDGDTAISWKMATSANAEYPTIILISPDIFVPNTTTGASKTLTVEIAQDGTTTALNDDEIWLEVEYLGTSGVPYSLFANDAKASFLASAAAQTDSSETWSGLGGTNKKQKLSVSVTPQEEGVFIVRICAAKASATVYVDPLVTVS